jgi:hypothetical protein
MSITVSSRCSPSKKNATLASLSWGKSSTLSDVTNNMLYYNAAAVILCVASTDEMNIVPSSKGALNLYIWSATGLLFSVLCVRIAGWTSALSLLEGREHNREQARAQTRGQVVILLLL